MKLLPLIAVLLLVTTTTSCQRGDAPTPEQVSAPEPAAMPSPTPPLADGAEMIYACTNDELRIVYARAEARVTFADGRELVLTRSPQPEGTGQELYEGDGMVLRRQDNVVHIRKDGSDSSECFELSATA